MPIKIPNNLPAQEVLENEHIFVMNENRALTQDILRCLANTPLQIEIDLLQTTTHKSKNVSEEHMLAFYQTFDDIKDNKYDGMIITGAPVEDMEFEEVDYWEELCKIMEWSKDNVQSTFHICWGAQAGLYYHYGIKKYKLKEKMFGIYKHRLITPKSRLFRGFDEEFYAPHSRHTTVRIEDIEKNPNLKLMAVSDEAGAYVVGDKEGTQFFVMGHSEYDADTLAKEYFRDVNKGLDIKVPVNYFPDDDPTKKPVLKWRAHSNLIYSNWLNYFVYQTTPYELSAGVHKK